MPTTIVIGRSAVRWTSFRRCGVAGLLALAVPAVVRAQPECPRGVLPAYAHNDYQNAQPLMDALALGFRGAEADVFLVHGVLRVGHDRRAARAGGTLEALYLAPLHALVARCGRLTADGQPWLLAVELKEPSVAAYDTLLALLGKYRPLLEASPEAGRLAPALALVLVGWHPPAPPPMGGVETLLGLQHRLSRPDEGGLPVLDARVHLLSLDYGKTMGRWWVTAAGRRRWLAALRAAKVGAPTRLLRVHNVPADGRIYTSLLQAGVDLIGTKQLSETSRILGVPDVP